MEKMLFQRRTFRNAASFPKKVVSMENEVTKKIEKVKCSAAGNLEVATGKLAEFCPLLVLCCIRLRGKLAVAT